MLKPIKNFLQKEPQFPFLTLLKENTGRLTPSEKTLLFFFAAVIFLSSGVLLWKLNREFLVSVPAKGGILREGIVGAPRFINPALATSNADDDITALVYSGLMKIDGSGKPAPDLAESFDISEDKLTYTFHLREGAVFHDGKPVGADDVIFTVGIIQNPVSESPKKANWSGVVARKLDDRSVQFVLESPYAPFIQNTTLGILPKHIWEDTPPDQLLFSKYNTQPIGSGPFKIVKVERDDSGTPNFYVLESFERYVSGEPYLDRLYLKIFSNENNVLDAYISGDIDSTTALHPDKFLQQLRKFSAVHTANLPRIFSVFFNQNHAPILADNTVRKALNIAVDRGKLVSKALSGFGAPSAGPLPAGLEDYMTDRRKADMPFSYKGIDSSTADTEIKHDLPIKEAGAILEKAGWKLNPETGIREKGSGADKKKLAFTLATADVAELKDTADLLKEWWASLGAEVTVAVFEPGDLNHAVIRQRKYDSLLFGQVIGRDMDLFAFWHSSQRNDPGLNVALYANFAADKLLEDARGAIDDKVRTGKITEFAEEIKSDTPAIFLYTPSFIYITPKNLQNVNLGRNVHPYERFLNINEWYIETEKVWKVFSG